MKEEPPIPQSKINEIFGKHYINYCVWIPVLLVGILLISTYLSLEGRARAWSIVISIISVNTFYIIYRILRYITLKKS